MSGPSTQKLSERRHSDNPILQIEEIRRFPLRGARVPTGATTLVFRSSSGRLTNPRGGYTAGEMLLRGPRVMYHVDLASHPIELEWDLGGPAGVNRTSIVVSANWLVSDPIVVVEQRVSDVRWTCRVAVQEAIGDVPHPSSSEVPLVQFALQSRLRDAMELAEGIRLERIRVRLRLRPAQDESGLVKELLAGDDEEPNLSDDSLVDSWQSDSEIAKAGLAALENGEWGASDIPRIRAARAGLERLAELTERLSHHLPVPPPRPANSEDRDGDG